MPFYGDIQSELDTISQRQQARDMAQRQAKKVTVDQIQRANKIQRDYKWLPAGASMAFAKGGLDDDTIHRVASQLVETKTNNTALGFNKAGQPVNAATEAKRAKAEWVAKLEGKNPLSKAVNALNRPIAGDAPKGALGWGGSKVINAAASGDNPAANALRGATRNITAAFDLPMQSIQGQYRNTAGQIEREGWGSLFTGEKWDPEGFKDRPSFHAQTDLGQTLGHLFGGKKVDQGSGFFVGDKSGVANARREAQGAYGYWETPDGRKIIHSIGRDFAGQFFEPGSNGFSRLSGVADFSVAVGADLPFSWVTGISKASKGFKAVGEGIEHADDATRVQKTRDALGMIFNPGSRTTHSPEVLENWLSMKQGIKTAEEFAAADATEIWAKSKGNMRAGLVQQFADAKTADEVRDVFRANLGQGIDSVPTRAISKYGVTLKESYMSPSMKRMVNRLPKESWMDADDPDEVLTQFDRQLDAMIMPPDKKKTFFDRMAMIPHKPGDRATWNLRKKVYMDALDDTIDRAVLQQSDLTGLEDIDVFRADLKKGTYLDDLGVETPFTKDQLAKVNEIRENQKRVREVFNPLKEGRYKDDVIFDMDNLSIWQGVVKEPKAPFEFHKGPLDIVDKRGAGDPEAAKALFGDVLSPDELADATSGKITSPGIEKLYSPEEAAKSGKKMVGQQQFPDLSHAADIVNRLRAVIYKHAEDLPPDISNVLKEYVEATYKHTGKNTLEEAGKILEGLGEGYHLEVDKLLRDLGVPEQVTVYRGYSPVPPSLMEDRLVDMGMLDPEGGAFLKEPIPLLKNGEIINAQTVGDLMRYLRNDARVLPEWARKHGAIDMFGNAPRGEYVNASLFRASAEGFGDVEEIQVPRSAILGMGSPGEGEVILRTDAVGGQYRPAGEFLLGKGNDPWLMAEFHGRGLPTPDWGAVHKELSTIGPMLNAKGDLGYTQWAHTVQEQFWKPLVVLRPAAALRIIGETQAGLWASGFSSIYTHPLNLISMALADTKLGERFKRGTAGATGVLGDYIEDSDAVKKAMNVGTIYTNHHTSKYLADGMVRIQKGERNYHEAVFYEINMFRKEPNDPLPRMIAQSRLDNELLTKVEEQLWAMPDYRKQIQEYAPARVSGDDFEVMSDRRGSDAYVRRLAQRMTEMTGDDPILLQEIVEGKMTREELLDYIKGMDQDMLRDEVHGPRKLSGKQEKSRSAVVNQLFSYLIKKPVHAWSEAPAVRQSYWKEVKALAPLMDPEHAAELVANAEKAGLKAGEIRQLKYFAEREVLDAKNALSIQQVDELGNYSATKTLQRLFEDHVDKRRYIDALGLISPFAHVWAESMSRWSRFLAEDPSLLHQLDYAYTAAKNPDVAESVGGSALGVPEGRGFLHPDANGQERFAYPMSAQLMKQFTGVNVPLTGSLQGLSMGFDIVPGVGPIASMPISATIPKTPEWDSVRDIVFPFGQPKSLLDIKQQAPAWMRRTLGWDDKRTQASTTMDIMRTKMASGDYDIHNPDPVTAEAESKRLLSESRQSATWFTAIRGLAGAVSPSAPAPEWWLDDKTGKRVMLNTLSQDFQQMYTDDPQHAVLNFMERYGENVMLAIQGKTQSVALGGGLPPTKKAEQWVRGEAKGIDDDYKLAYGFFAPRGDGDKLDFSVYDRQLDRGERTQLTPEQMLQESNKRVAQTMYYATRNELPANMSVRQSALMRKLRDDLSARFPGYESKYGEDIVGVPQQASVGQTIKQLEAAIGDHRLANNPATSTLRDYLSARAQVRASSAAHLTDQDSWATSKKGARARASLYNLGSKLAQQNKAFAPMWESALYREFQSDYEADQGLKG